MKPSTNYHCSGAARRRKLSGMLLNHLDLLVCDVPATAAFFERYFGLCVRSNPTSAALIVLTDAHGFVLVLQRAQPGQRYPEGFHLGFLLDDVQSVRDLHARAVADGLQVSEIIVNGRGTMIYVTLPEGFHVEVSCQNRRFAPAPGASVEATAPPPAA